MLIQENCNKFLIIHLTNSRDVFRLVLSGLNILGEQLQLLTCAEMLRSDAGVPAARVKSLESQVVTRSAWLGSGRGDRTRLEQFDEVVRLS